MNTTGLYRHLAAVVYILAAGTLCGCATTASRETGDPEIRRSIAVLYFNNNNVTDSIGQDPSKKLVADVLITNLASVPGLAVVERSRLENVLDELSVGSSELADRETQLRLGRLLGARSLVVGDYMAFGSTLNLDARVVDVETSRIVYSAQVMGPGNRIFQLVWMLAGKISTGLGLGLPDPPRAGSIGRSVASDYSRGLDLLDADDYAGARRIFEQVLEDNPGNAGARARIEEIESRN